MPVHHDLFGRTAEGTPIDHYTLVNSHGVTADIITLGGTWIAMRVPDRAGTLSDVLLGFETLAPYLGNHPFFGSLVGRYANRIANGRFELNGKTYTLARNNGTNHLHGGPTGFHKRVWNAQASESPTGPRVDLEYHSADGEEGYPGNLSVAVSYTLGEQNDLRIDYTATTDQNTVINLTNHAYFNLAVSGDILGHELELPAAYFLPTNKTQIPTGELRPVHGTPMDFTTPTRIGTRITANDEQIHQALGYDHNWVLDKPAGSLGLAGRLYDPVSGRALEVSTTQPGVQFYAGNVLDGTLTGKGGKMYARHTGMCLETQHFPDSPNQPQFPSTILRPGETYQHTTIFQFLTR